MPAKRPNGSTGRRPGRPAGAKPQAGHDALLRAAREILTENGGSTAITLTEVARRAGVNPAMVNYYFGGKSDLIATLIKQATDESLKRVVDIPPGKGSPKEKLAKRVNSVVELYREYPYVSRLLKEEVFYSSGSVRETYLEGFLPTALHATQKILDEGVRTGEFRAVDPLLFWASLIGICEFFFLAFPVIEKQVGEGQPPRNVQEFAEYATELLLYGIVSRDGEAKPESNAKTKTPKAAKTRAVVRSTRSSLRGSS
jgi:AcrR family transcriptional regulator